MNKLGIALFCAAAFTYGLYSVVAARHLAAIHARAYVRVPVVGPFIADVVGGRVGVMLSRGVGVLLCVAAIVIAVRAWG